MVNVIELLQKLSAIGKRKGARKIIYSVEESARASGLSNIDVLRYTSDELKGDEVFDAIIKLFSKQKQVFKTGTALLLDAAIALLSKGKPRSMAYKDILGADILCVLRAAENRGITGSDMFKSYSKMEAIIVRAESKMRNALIGPTITYVLAGVLSYYSVNTFYTSFSSVPNVDISAISFLRNYFAFLVSAPIILAHFIIMKYPDKVPKWQKVYKHVKSTNYLLVTKTLFDSGMSSMDALSFLRKINDKHLKLDKLRNKNDMGALTTALSYYMTPVEIALLKTSAKATEERRVISNIAEDRISEIEETVSTATGTFNKMFTLLAAWPVGIALFTFVDIINSVSRMGAGK